MTVEHARSTSVQRTPVRVPGRAGLATAPRAPVRPVGPDTTPLCLVVPEIADGDSGNLVRTLRRRESTRAILLTRKAARRDLVSLLGAGIRGAIAAEPPGGLRLAERTTAAPAPLPVEHPAGIELTTRELGVLRLVADGQSNRQVGEQLGLSALTVKSHLARISRKVGTGDRAEMVAYAIRHELLG